MRKILIGIIVLVVTVSLSNAKEDQNSPGETYNLGLRYLKGTGVKKDIKFAHNLFLKSANMGYARAQYNMGILYLKGISFKQDSQKAFKWFEMASRQNVPEALYMMGWLYEEGEGVKKDFMKAFEYYISAADLGEKSALERIEKEGPLESIKKEVLLKKDKELYSKGKTAYQQGNYQSSIDYFKMSLNTREEVLGKENPDTIICYSNIGMAYHSMGDYSKALEQFQIVLTLRDKALGKKDPETVKSYSNIGMVYHSMGDYPKALEYYQKALDISEKEFGKENKVTANLYKNISFVYDSMGTHSKTFAFLQKYRTAIKKILSKQNLNSATFYSYHGSASIRDGDYQKALDYFQMALIIIERIKGKKHSDTADIYNNIGMAYHSMGDYSKALDYFEKALSIREKVLGKEHSNTISSYNNIGAVYYAWGDYPKALEYHQKALGQFEKMLGKEHIATAASYNNMGQVYQSMGDYPKALEYYQKALAVRKKVKRKNFTGTAASYNNIGTVYNLMGGYQKALEYYKMALGIYRSVLGQENPKTLLAYGNIGGSYELIGDYPKALEHSKKVLTLRKNKLGEEHPDTARSYRNVGLVYESMGDYPKALKYIQKSLTIFEIVLGENHPDTASAYIDFGATHESIGDHSKALEYFQKALAIYEKILGKEHPNTATSYINISVVYKSMGDYPKAYHYAQLAFNTFLNNRDLVFTILDSKQKEKYLKSTSGYITSLLSSTYHYITQLKKETNNTKIQQTLQSGANSWLNYKGAVFDSENAISMLYINTKDNNLKAKIDELITSKRYLAKLYQSLPSPKERNVWQSRIKNTEEKIARLTNEIAAKAESIKEQQVLKSITYKDISSHLGEDELYIDYAKAGGYYYLFSLDKKENITFVQIDKNSTKTIDSLVKTFREDVNTILKSKDLTDENLNRLTKDSKEKLSKLYSIVIKKPLGDIIKEKTSLIISPDGALRLLPFEALYDKEHNKYFIEEKEIRYIPSGKELVRLYKYSKDKITNVKQNAVIFANPNFNTKIASISKEQMAITPNTNRSGIIKSLFRMRFDPLPGTEVEANAIKATLNEKSILEYQTNNATESNLVNVKEPKILHIATHGFFINDNSIPNPMLKSGIALAGANDSAIKGKSDGIVTALKLSGLELKGTDLVVLSACQTGVVDINSTESVSGLSKAFIQAGAKDIVMSLWSVDDQATKELMTSFYQEMKENKNYAKALKVAKLKMIGEGRHPFYWGAFVVSGL